MTLSPDTVKTRNRSLVIPVYRNEENIFDLVEALNLLHQSLEGLEVVFVIDGSPDRSGDYLMSLESSFEFSAQILFLSRNFGSFTAIRTGIEFARGEMIAVMAADLQEPPELILSMYQLLESDIADVVFGQRIQRDDPFVSKLLSNIFWWVYRKLIISSMPSGGIDIFACNHNVSQAILQISEPNSSLVAQLFWVGFRRRFVPYIRRARTKGKSSWNFSRKMRYMMDSIIGFSDLPILSVLWIGLFGCFSSLAFGTFVVTARFLNLVNVPGYTATVFMIAFSMSLQLFVQGVFGAYLWRTFENTKSRPLRILQHRIVID